MDCKSTHFFGKYTTAIKKSTNWEIDNWKMWKCGNVKMREGDRVQITPFELQ